MRVADLDTDSSVSTAVDGTRFAVHPEAAVYLRALRIARLADGAGRDDAAIGDGDEPVASRTITKAVRAPINDLGIAIAHGGISTGQPDAKRWANRWGVSVQQL